MKYLISLLAVILTLTTLVTHATDLQLKSSNIQHGRFMTKAHEFNGFGCDGQDLSPQLSWSGAPKQTKSFAITAYDPDAPTGSGWWHWQLINIPAEVSEIKQGAGKPNADLLPKGSVQIINDYGSRGFGGACPAKGNGAHRYQFTLHALSVESLDLPDDASAALTGFMINSNTIETSTIEALYIREK